jgi:hypothetical protein
VTIAWRVAAVVSARDIGSLSLNDV